MFVVPSMLKRLRGSSRRLIWSWRYFAYSRFIKFSVAPESMRASASALFNFEWMKNRRFIDFLLDMYTSDVDLHLISADLIKHLENPVGVPLPSSELVCCILHH